MKQHILNFLHLHLNPSKPILLGLSGGPDSLTLLHLLQECCQIFPFELGIAHVDHGWRKESRGQAQQLAEMVGKMGMPFHLVSLEPNVFSGNIEAFCREKRLEFFSGLCQKYGYQAVILGHHADDLAETVLKRVFEGASISLLSGIQPVVSIETMQIWRPLLAVRRKEILEYVSRHQLTPFHDETNLDPKFLRGRFRTSITPYIIQQFKKDITRPLQRLSEESIELKKYLDLNTEPLFSLIQSGGFGLFLDLSHHEPCIDIELKHLIKRFCEKGNLHLSYEQVLNSLQAVRSTAANKQYHSNHKRLYIDRKRMFLPYFPMDSTEIHQMKLDPEKKQLETENRFHIWKITTKCLPYVEGVNRCGWQDVWRGKFSLIVPLAKYSIGVVSPSHPFQSSPIGDLWTKSKTPAFFRTIVPVLLKNGEVFHEFLSSKKFFKLEKQQEALQITFQLNQTNE